MGLRERVSARVATLAVTGVVVAALVGACGSSSPQPTRDTGPVASSVTDTPTPATSSSSPTRGHAQGDAHAEFKSDTGDTVSVDVQIGPVEPASTLQDGSAQCFRSPAEMERTLVLPVRVVSTLTSSLALPFTVGVFLPPGADALSTQKVTVVAGHVTCAESDGMKASWDLRPQAPKGFTVYWLNPKGITVDHPEGDERVFKDVTFRVRPLGFPAEPVGDGWTGVSVQGDCATGATDILAFGGGVAC